MWEEYNKHYTSIFIFGYSHRENLDIYLKVLQVLTYFHGKVFLFKDREMLHNRGF